jgi:uncharacterized membrane protein YbhN (UPF0104 family)
MPPSSDHAAAHRRRIVVAALKTLLAVGILAWLLKGLVQEQAFRRLLDEPKHWPLLAIAQVLVLTAISLNYVRWYVLVRALDLNFKLSDAFRLGSLGLMLSQISLGSVGGDLFKAIAVAREQHGKRTEAVASVLIDRVVGLYAMLLLASAGYLANAQAADFGPLIRGLARTVLLGAAVGAIGIALLMTPWLTGPKVSELASRVPVVGGTLVRLIDAAGAYRHRHSRRYLFAGILMGCLTHVLFVLAYWCIARGLPTQAPPLATMFMITPMTLAAGAIPLTPSGLGIAEGAAGQLFASAGFRRSDGVLVAIAYRAMTYVMVAVGAMYYMRASRSVVEAIHEAEEASEDDQSAAVTAG